jgi:hypothetical protein
MHAHRVSDAALGRGTVSRDSIGGAGVLPADMPWPACECGEPMALFFQLDVAAAFGLPFRAGSHLAVFMCPAHNDAPEQFDTHVLPARHWERRRRIDGSLRFYEVILFKPGRRERTHPREPHLVPRRLRFEQAIEAVDGLQGFKVGGHPFWCQAPAYHACPCGAEMRLLCQVPEDHPFRKAAGAAPQPDAFSATAYGLFLGNAVYLLACEAQCSPFAVHPVVQN